MSTRERETLPSGFYVTQNEDGDACIEHLCNDDVAGLAAFDAFEVEGDNPRKALTCQHCHWSSWISKLRH